MKVEPLRRAPPALGWPGGMSLILAFSRHNLRKRASAWVALAMMAGILSLAGCGSSSSGEHSPTPPEITYPTTTAVYTRTVAIAPDAPANIGGPITSYSVVPALPAGISLDATTGIVSGTPTAVTSQAVYTVTATNAGGIGRATLTITVNDLAPAGLSYSVNPATYAANTAITPDAPSWSSSGGTPTSFSAQQLLPQGLTLDPNTGILSGTPTGQTAQATYTIVATNSGGNTSAALTITVNPQAPYFITQPASQYVGSGIYTYFTANVGGPITLNYQWYKNGSPVAQTTIGEYVTPVLTSADNGDQIDVVVSDTYGRSITSQTATITIKGVAGTFVNTGTPSIARSGATATLLPNGQVLIVGGQNGNIVLGTAELYDPATGVFTLTHGTLATARSGHNATLLPNGQVLIAGGTPGGLSATLSSAELYDPVAQTFSSTGSLAVSREDASATLLGSGKVLIAGGSHSADGFNYSAVAPAELYDPVAGTFSSTGSFNTARSVPAILLQNGQVFFAGGIDVNTGYIASAELYDPTAGTFSFTTGSLNTARNFYGASILQNGKVLITGGDSNASTTSAELYDPTSQTFSYTGTPNVGAGGQSATLLPDGQVLLVGGAVGGFVIQQTLNMTELYDPASGVFIFNAPTNTERDSHTATLLPNGQVLITGQETSAVSMTPPAPAELYKP